MNFGRPENTEDTNEKCLKELLRVGRPNSCIPRDPAINLDKAMPLDTLKIGMLKNHPFFKTKISKSLEETQSLELLPIFRTALLLEAVVYFVWHFLVRAQYPDSYNPLSTRLVVVVFALVIYFLSFKSSYVRKNIENWFYATVYVLTIHNFYLKHINFDNVVWPVNIYITVIAICECFHSRRALFFYSIFVLATGVIISRLHANPYAFYIPGLFTILLVTNLGLYHRFVILNRLSDASNRFQELFHSTFEGIMLHEKGIIVDVNKPFSDLFNYAREEMIGMPVMDLVQAEYQQEMREKSMADLSHFSETWGVQKNGATIPIEVSVKDHQWAGRTVRLVTVRDVSERLLAEEERRKAIQAEAEVRLRDEFISIASHELKTPLTPIRLNNDMLLRAVKENKLFDYPYAKLQKMFEMTANQVGRLCRLIDDMLDVSQMDRDDMILNFEFFNLKDLLDEIIFSVSDELSRTGTTLKLQSIVTVEVYWDRHRMEQVIGNLLRNAIIYGRGKEILVSLERHEKMLHIIVRDQGIGIDKKDQRRIFNRFERAVSSKNYGGLGLGLYITGKIINAHQGNVRVESESGKGSTFTVEIPIRPSLSDVDLQPTNETV